MIVDSLGIEYGYELIQVIPYAYYLYTKGLLEKTISAQDTSALYYFSPNHIEKYKIRSWKDTNKAIKNLPIKTIHTPDLTPLDKWICPPYKEYYKNNEFIFNKPLLIISNKYSVEWNKPPVNYIDINTLDIILNKLKNKYQIVYFRAEPNLTLEQDDQPTINYNDKTFIKEKHSEVLLFEDIYKTTNYSVDLFQLKLFANCNNFISAQGGTAVISSYFGGTNLVFAKQGGEVNTNSINNWYHKFSGAKVIHCKTYDVLIKNINNYS